MIDIRPISDLRNKFSEIEKQVTKEDKSIYLTKNGYGSMVVMSIKKYERLIKEISYIENALDEADEQIKQGKFLKEREVFDKIREEINEKI